MTGGTSPGAWNILASSCRRTSTGWKEPIYASSDRKSWTPCCGRDDYKLGGIALARLPPNLHQGPVRVSHSMNNGGADGG